MAESKEEYTEDLPGGSLCPFCGSSEVSRDEDSGNLICIRCDREFRLQPEAADDKGETKAVKAPWELPEGMAKPGKHHGRSDGYFKPQRMDEGTALLLLPLNMQIAFNWVLKLAMILGGIFTVTLGGHGLHVYFNAIDGLLPEGRDAADLFLVTDVPGQLKGIIEWCTARGLSSWTTPASLIAAGPFLWILQTYVPARRFRL